MKKAAALLCLAVNAWADVETTPHILNGNAVNVGDFPTVVALVLENGLCTGTLIHPEWILTAAHCVDPAVLQMGSQQEVTDELFIIFDDIDVSDRIVTGRSVRAAATIKHQNFSINGLGDNDIGLVRLAEPVTDRMVSRINRDASHAAVGTAMTLVGFGQTETGSFGRGFVLRDKPSSSCAVFGASNSNLICFNQQDGTGSCSGDSGGPGFAMIDNVLTVAGVTSFGDQNCEVAGAYTRLSAEIDFVDQHIGAAIRCVNDGVCDPTCTMSDADCPTCDSDDQCENGFTCQQNFCAPEPFTPGGLGSDCAANAECMSGLCLDQGADGQLCSATCELGSNECPEEFSCLEFAGEALGRCWPGADSTQPGGCCAGGQPASLLWGLGLLGLISRRRRQ